MYFPSFLFMYHVDCDCPWNERCTTPHGDCVCDEHQVRDHQSGSCVDCDPDLCKFRQIDTFKEKCKDEIQLHLK